MVSGTAISHRHKAGQGPSAAMDAVAAAVDRFAVAQALGAVTARRLAIVAEEIVANLLDHAAHDRDIAFTLTLEPLGDGPGLTLVDDSDAFDPRSVAPAEMPNPERGGGVGLTLVRAWCDIVSYDSDLGSNRLILRFRPAG
jgi:anti-sigma regulatory factor (Ser/Thr protein kinase)